MIISNSVGRYKVINDPNFTDGTKWKFTRTNIHELARLVFNFNEVTEQTESEKRGFDDAGYSIPFFSDDISKKDSLYMIGKDRGGKLHWVIITDITGKLLSRSTIEGKRGGKLVADQLSELSHYHESTGLYADLKRKKENEEAANEQRRIEDTAFIHNIGRTEKGEQIQMQVMKPTPQRSDIVSHIEDVIHSDVESISSDTLTITTAETSFIKKVVDSPKPIENLAGATYKELSAFGFTV